MISQEVQVGWMYYLGVNSALFISHGIRRYSDCVALGRSRFSED